MARIKCHYTDCVFLDDGYCSAASVELDPQTGCATFVPNEEAAAKDEDWEEDEQEEEEDDVDEEEDNTWEEDKDGL